MTKFVHGLLICSLVLTQVSAVQAFGKRRAKSCEAPCEVVSDSCGTSWSGMEGGCGVATAYTEQTVTMYRTEYKPREVESVVNKVVTKEVEEEYKYTEMVAVTKPEKRTETVYTTVQKQVPYTYNVMVPVVTPTKQTVTEYTTVTKQVPYTYNVTVPVVTPTKQTVTEYTTVTKQVPYTYTVSVPVVTPTVQTQTVNVCKPMQVTHTVPVTRMVSSCEVDPCTGCSRTVCKPVCEMQTVCKTVMQMVPETRQVTVNVCSYKTEQRTATRMVCETVPVTREVTVNVCSYKTEQRTATRMVCETVPVTREVTVNVCSYKTEQRTATRTVCETVPQTREYTVNVVSYNPVEKTGKRMKLVSEVVQEKVKSTVMDAVQVPYTTTVKVPVYDACGSAAMTTTSGFCGSCGTVAAPCATTRSWGCGCK